ncbi:esterase/lipase family protein [Rhodococcus kronopolitis]|uniref:Esterase/lipase family protein n=1 Tax=Rhodococcus kronopolitis TaxID=1460226 RepID=A0ABV9FX86_9NOCA
MTTRLRAATTSLATIALLTLGTALMPSTTASAQLGSSGSSGGAGAGEIPGVNEEGCTSTQHPQPVVLLHGTDMTWQDTFEDLVPPLKGDGYCLFAFNYGGLPAKNELLPRTAWGTKPIEQSAAELNTYIDDLLERTGAEQVDIVSHSQGGTMTRQYLRFLGGADRPKVKTLVMLAPSTHGSTGGDTFFTEAQAAAADAPVAIQQQVIGSRFLTALNADNKETFPGIQYTVIASNTDEVITPAPPKIATNLSLLIPAPGTEDSVHNITVQDVCNDPGLLIRHNDDVNKDTGKPMGMLNHPAPLFLVRKALDPTLADTISCS